MVAITDKFGKASAPDAYAPATTVKNVKNAGESTLSAYDLSKFDDTVPLFFITYKKTTHPETGATIRLNQAGWKGLVNKDSNTITNLVLAPGYTDPGQAPGDYIEAIPTSFWANELVDGILVSHNPDGTVKDKVITPANFTSTDKGVVQVDKDGNTVVAKVPSGNVDWATLKTKIVTYTATSTGTKTITGLGFKPRIVRTQFAGNSPHATYAGTGIAIDGKGQALTSSAVYFSGTAGEANARSATNRFFGVVNTTPGGAFRTAGSIVSFDEDGITLNVIERNGDTDTYTFIFEE